MKIITHKLIIYENGWKFKWEKKPDTGITINLLDVLIVCFIFYFLIFN